MNIRLVESKDWPEWLRMRKSLWPDSSESKHKKEMLDWIANLHDYPVFVADDSDGRLCGFVEASLHDSASACLTGPVGYIEGWYVDEDIREKGIGRQLILQAEQWAVSRGFKEMASDAEIGNLTSIVAHLRLDYREVERDEKLVKFAKAI